MNTVLIISFSDLARDPRVNRQIRFLKNDYQVIAAGSGDPVIDGVRYIDCGTGKKNIINKIMGKMLSAGILFTKRYEQYYWGRENIRKGLKKLQELNADVILANDMDSLPLALKIAHGAKIILDAHEYAPKEFDDMLMWKIFMKKYKEYLCRQYIAKVDGMMTVCQGIAEEYGKQYGVYPLVITNAPDYEDIAPRMTDPRRIRMIYHGGATKSRKIENMILMLDHLDDRFELDLILVPGSPQYIKKLKKMACRYRKINVLPPVPMKELVRFTNQYDIGLYILEPSNFNNKYALPNKFFEFIQARLAIAIGPSPEMARIVKEYECGIVSEDFTPRSLANRLMGLDEKQINRFKHQSHAIAGIMSSAFNKEKVIDLIESVSAKRQQ